MKTVIYFITMLLLFNTCTSQNKKSKQMETKKYESIMVFGDGLSDMGRWGKLTNYQYPPAAHGFFESRWTNGKVWVEHFADSLDLKLTLENNYSMGGATTGLYNINEPLRTALGLDSTAMLQGMLAQVQTYLVSNPEISEKTLFILWAGGHDIGSYLDYGQPDLKQYPPAGNYKQAVDMLINAGAKHFLIGTMPDMGYTPVYFGTDKQQIASDLCNELNAGLENMMQEYSKNGVEFIRIDGARIFAEVGSNPQKYGFNYTEPYLPLEIIDFSNPLKQTDIRIPNKEKGLNPDEFMNWWAVSASARMHQILATEALKTIHSKQYTK